MTKTIMIVVAVTAYVVGVVIVGKASVRMLKDICPGELDGIDYLAPGMSAMLWPVLLIALGPPRLLGRLLAWLVRRRAS